ncbi:MAG: hypothetical protein GY743_23310 [Planctomycetaceae bacterium]|nr:hypothetical protein [Planctomycetaceae bacterium]
MQDALVKITDSTNTYYLYHEGNRGTLKRVGREIALCARKVTEGEIDRSVAYDWLCLSGLHLHPTSSGIERDEIAHYYHLDLLPSGNVIVGYDYIDEGPHKRYLVNSFIKKVNRSIGNVSTGLCPKLRRV